MESNRPPEFCRLIVGESSRNLGRMGDYLSAQRSAATDFKMGTPVEYLQPRGCPVVMKYKAAENRRAEQDRLHGALEAEGHLLLVLRRIPEKPGGSLGAQGASFDLHRNADLLKWAQRILAAQDLTPTAREASRKQKYERIGRDDRKHVLDALRRAGLVYVHVENYGTAAELDQGRGGGDGCVVVEGRCAHCPEPAYLPCSAIPRNTWASDLARSMTGPSRTSFRVRGRLTGPTGRSEDAELLVDTGATLLVVPRSLAQRLELAPRRSQSVVIGSSARGLRSAA